MLRWSGGEEGTSVSATGRLLAILPKRLRPHPRPAPEDKQEFGEELTDERIRILDDYLRR